MKKGLKYFFLICYLLVGCKDSSKTHTAKDEKPINEQVYTDDFSNNFIVEIEAKVEKDDVFHAFYLTESFEDYFKGSQAIGKPVKGSQNFQKIKIELPKDTIPSRLRIDFGSNVEQKEIEISSIKLIFEDKNLAITDSLFSKYFTPNNNVKSIEGTNKVSLNVDDQGKYDPYIIGKVWLNRKLKELIN